MPITLTPTGTGGEEDEARFELLGVLLLAWVTDDDEATKNNLRRYVSDRRISMTNSDLLASAGGHLTLIADVRSGAAISVPVVTLHGSALPETMLVALAGQPLGRIVNGWLAHPGIIIDATETDTDPALTRFRIRRTELTIDEVIQAIEDTASERQEQARMTCAGKETASP